MASLIIPKFGFKSIYFIESMNWQKTGQVPEDSVLFNKSLREYQNNLIAGKKTFGFLVTLFTHGPYTEVDGDGGEGDYKKRLQKTVNEFVAFQKNILKMAKKKNRPVMFLIFGDHKPAMTLSFYKRHVFNEDFFSVRGEDNKSFQFIDHFNNEQKIEYGRVPLFIKSEGLQTIDFVKKIVADIADKPIYCLPGGLSNSLRWSNEFYGYLHEVCHSSHRLI